MTQVELIAELKKSRAAHLAEIVRTRTKPSVRLHTQPTELTGLPMGASRMGGVPDLPSGVAWPHCGHTPLAFISHIRMSDTTVFDQDSLLPSTGWLCFFYDACSQPAGYDPAHASAWRMMYFAAPGESLCRVAAPGVPEGCDFQPCSLVLEAEDTIPDSSALCSEGVLDGRSEEFSAYFKFVKQLSTRDDRCRHRLLGNPDVIQGEMRFTCQYATNGLACGNPSVWRDPRATALARNALDWVLLLQIDSDEDGPGWMWGDCGLLYCWIRQQDLARLDFDHVWVVKHSY